MFTAAILLISIVDTNDHQIFYLKSYLFFLNNPEWSLGQREEGIVT
jgi:hypothetical protein